MRTGRKAEKKPVRRPAPRGAGARRSPAKKGPGLGQRLSQATPWLLMGVMAMAVLVSVIWLPQVLDSYPVRHIAVEGVTDERRQQEVRLTLSERVSGENFFSMPLGRIHDEVSGIAWVAGVSVRRQWPDKLVLSIEERVPVAVWNERLLVSSAGEPFPGLDKYSLKGLPKLSGPEQRLDEVMSYYHSMSKLLQRVELGIHRMRVDARLTAWLELDNGIEVVVDRERFATKLRRFVRLYQGALGVDSRGLARVDLRYADGMAVEWRDDNASPEKEERV